jgi:hypothetical protein
MYSVCTVQGTGTSETAVNNDALGGGGEGGAAGRGLAELRTYIVQNPIIITEPHAYGNIMKL